MRAGRGRQRQAEAGKSQCNCGARFTSLRRQPTGASSRDTLLSVERIGASSRDTHPFSHTGPTASPHTGLDRDVWGSSKMNSLQNLKKGIKKHERIGL